MEQPAKASVFPAADRSSWQALLLSSGVLIVLIAGSLMFGPVALTPGQVVTGLFALAADPRCGQSDGRSSDVQEAPRIDPGLGGSGGRTQHSRDNRMQAKEAR